MDNITYYDIRDLLENKRVSKSIIFFLMQKDLLRSIVQNTLPFYQEDAINFEPTYKRNKHTGVIQLSKSGILQRDYRLPGYADRILLKSVDNVRAGKYNTLEYIPGSDHLPVSYVFQVKHLKVAIITWNVASGNPNKLSPKTLKNIDFCRNTSDILIIAFQEVHNTRFEPLLWSRYYNSHISIEGRYLNRRLGYGIDTYVFWNSDNVSVSEIQSKYHGSLTKGFQLVNLRLVRYVNYQKKIFSLLLSNTHAPFTNSINKYGSFFSHLHDILSSYQNIDLSCVFGDLNSRSLLKINKHGTEKLIKNIKSSKVAPEQPETVMSILNSNFKKWKQFKKICGVKCRF